MIDAASKTFVLDTNVLLHNPRSLFAFADNHVVIPMVVLEELDKFKSGSNELGRNSGKLPEPSTNCVVMVPRATASLPNKVVGASHLTP